MLRRILVLFCGLLISSVLVSQTSTSTTAPIKYRLLMTSVSVQDVNKNEIAITLNAFNTGRNPIDFSSFDAVPQEMEIKFEESFYRSNLNQLEEDIISNLLNKNITINNGKILRNLRFNLPCNEILYKELTKKEKRYSRNYSPRSKSSAPALKYKISKKKKPAFPNAIAKKKKKTSKPDVKEEIAKNGDMEIPNSENNNTETFKEVDIFEAESKEIEIESTGMALEEKAIKEKIKTEQSKPKTKKVIDNPQIEIEENLEISEPVNSDIEETSVAIVEKSKEKKASIFEKKKQKKRDLEEVKNDSYKIEQAAQKEEQKAILESLGVSDDKAKKAKSKKENSEDSGVAFDTRAGVEESKNSYVEKSVCPDMIIENISVIKKNSKWITIEYTLTNVGKGPAFLGKSANSQGLALRAFLSSSENISRGSLPLGGGFVSYNAKDGKDLHPETSFTGTLKLDIRKMTKFTPYVILNFDPFNVLEECTKANNYGQIKIGG